MIDQGNMYRLQEAINSYSNSCYNYYMCFSSKIYSVLNRRGLNILYIESFYWGNPQISLFEGHFCRAHSALYFINPTVYFLGNHSKIISTKNHLNPISFDHSIEIDDLDRWKKILRRPWRVSLNRRRLYIWTSSCLFECMDMDL